MSTKVAMTDSCVNFFMKPPILVKNTGCHTACHALING